MNVVRLDEEDDGDLVKQRHLLVDPSSGNKKTPNQGPSDMHCCKSLLSDHLLEVCSVFSDWRMLVYYSRNNTSSF